jgi:hypothetical protein
MLRRPRRSLKKQARPSRLSSTIVRYHLKLTGSLRSRSAGRIGLSFESLAVRGNLRAAKHCFRRPSGKVRAVQDSSAAISVVPFPSGVRCETIPRVVVCRVRKSGATGKGQGLVALRVLSVCCGRCAMPPSAVVPHAFHQRTPEQIEAPEQADTSNRSCVTSPSRCFCPSRRTGSDSATFRLITRPELRPANPRCPSPRQIVRRPDHAWHATRLVVAAEQQF